uniref:Uncharacterized protein n=1 Tax=Anguilla anguilla TaxID=7936 RepID=A0A0E9XZN4_ANGAN
MSFVSASFSLVKNMVLQIKTRENHVPYREKNVMLGIQRI